METFYIILFVIALLYAAVGHGGASGYLALMALYGFSPSTMKPTALTLNLFVSLISFIQYYRGRHFIFKIFLPLAMTSVPMSFIGGTITVNDLIYKKILGVLLLIPVIRFLFFKSSDTELLKTHNVALCLLIGGSIGLLSGMIGIGGGIILSPVLLLLNWTNQKQAAAISALFIFVNSLAGLAGQLTSDIQFTDNMILSVIIAFTGGLCGAYLGALKFNQTILKNLLSVILFMAALKLITGG